MWILKASEGKVRSISCIPTGNLGASQGAYSTRSGLKCTIFLSCDEDLDKFYRYWKSEEAGLLFY